MVADRERWMLPEAIDELLPPRAAELESLRRRLLDLYASWGYELCMPPLVERLDALLTGAGSDLDSQTVKLVDPLDGALLGIRADMTPQTARIDAHRLANEGPSRLCYIGDVLRAHPEAPGQTRNPIQVGVELFGHAGRESDLEVLGLMIETLQAAGLDTIHLDLGHVAIFRAMARCAGLPDAQRYQVQQLLQSKCLPEIEAAAPGSGIATLATLHGGSDVVLARARKELPKDTEITAALDELTTVVDWLAQQYPTVDICFDLSELPGYSYHTGLVFSAFVPGHGRVLARGGRYDQAGEAFGRSRPATGFSTNLRSVARLVLGKDSDAQGIFAPAGDAAELVAEIRRLRGAGERVVQALPNATQSAADCGCDRQLVGSDSGWQVSPAN